MMLPLQDIKRNWKYLSPKERTALMELIETDPAIWRPLPGPQTEAFNSKADILGYGGAAGGGKTDLGCGKTLTQHVRSIAFRRVGTELQGILDRLTAMIGHDDGFNGQKKVWKLGTRQIELGSVPNAGDERGYQGRDHDLLWFDEAANFLRSQIIFLMGWNRTTLPNQRCQTLMTFNPPTTNEGLWITDFFAPWINKKNPGPLGPAQPGELRWFGVVSDGRESRDVHLEDGRPFVVVKGEIVFDFDPDDFDPTEIIQPRTRTFIPSRVTDNPYLMGTGYMSTLQAMPEPLRSQMLKGDFEAGIQDGAYQVIPTKWVDDAMARWKEPAIKPEMLTVGCDPARGGRDNTVIARKHLNNWFDKPIVHPGTATPDGPTVAGHVIVATRDSAAQIIEVDGIGSSPYDFLLKADQDVTGITAGGGSVATSKCGKLRFRNKRSELWWKMRETLDPDNNTGVALPPDQRLRADLCAPQFKVEGNIIKVEGRDEIIKRIERSPDFGTAYILANVDMPKRSSVIGMRNQRHEDYDPYERRDFDPYNSIR